MTNTINKMAGRNGVERFGSAAKNRGKNRGGNSKVPVSTSPSTVFTPPRVLVPQGYVYARHSPAGGRGSPRSPGADRFAGAKWTDPPAPNALPPPPVHWMKPEATRGLLTRMGCEIEAAAVRSQLKMMLKGQA